MCVACWGHTTAGSVAVEFPSLAKSLVGGTTPAEPLIPPYPLLSSQPQMLSERPQYTRRGAGTREISGSTSAFFGLRAKKVKETPLHKSQMLC